jgi:HEAT repeat protein
VSAQAISSWLPAVALKLTNSAEFYAALINSEYVTYLGRTADAAGLAGWVTQMQNGLRDEQLEADLVSSAEYLTENGGSANATWVASLYTKVLGRTGSQPEINNWVTLLNSGVQPTVVAAAFTASGEKESDRVIQDYRTYLKRTPSSGEVAPWVDGLQSRTLTNEGVVAAIVGSPEFFQDHSSNSIAWFTSAYPLLFPTAPLTSSLPSYVMPIGQTLAHSAEYYAGLINSEYVTFLGRNADAAGLAEWVAQMQNGLTDEQLEAGLVTSTEYLTKNGGSANATWVASLYTKVLGRTGSQAEINNWVQLLSSGVQPSVAAAAFTAGGEKETDRVIQDYRTYLNRTPSSSEFAPWVNGLQSHTLTNEGVIAAMVGSQEFFRDSSNSATTWWQRAVIALFESTGA